MHFTPFMMAVAAAAVVVAALAVSLSLSGWIWNIPLFSGSPKTSAFNSN